MNDRQDKSIRQTLNIVFKALEEKGEDPYVQLVGYLSSGDPAYLPQLNEARNLMSHYGSEDIIEALLHYYFNNSESADNQ